MDGAIPSLSADSTRRISARFQLSSRVSGAQSLQSSLFEQLLSLPAPFSSKGELTSAARSNDIESSGKSSYRSNSANERSSVDSSVTKSSSNEHDENDDIKSAAEEKAEKGATEGQVAVLNATPAAFSAAPKKPDAAASDVGASSALAADGNQTAQNPTDTGSASNQSLTQNTEDASVTAPQQSDPQLEVATASTTDTAEPPVDASLTRPPAGQGTSKSDQQAVSVESITQPDTSHASSQAEVVAAQAGNRGQAKSGAHAEARDTQADKQSAAASQGDRKPHGQRREKWFERGTQSPSSTFGAQHDAATNEAAKAVGDGAATTVNRSGVSDSAAVTADNQATMAQAADSGDLLSQSLDSTFIPVDAGLAPTETAAASIVNSSSLANPIDSASSLGGDSGATTTTAPEGVDSKSNAASAQRADAKSGANETQRPDALTQAERVRLVQRVSRSFARLGPMGGQINIRLHPPQLGSLNVQVRMEGRTMTAKLSTETSAARDAILESLPVLRSRLAEQGFQISSFHVEVADNHADATSGNGNPQASFDQSSGGDGGNQAGREADYRRLAAQQRQHLGSYSASRDGTAPRELAWQLLAGVDLQA